MSYVQEAEGKYFTDFLDNEEFQQDLKDFFSGGRYNYTPEQLENVEQLADDFAQHMRWQSTALRNIKGLHQFTKCDLTFLRSFLIWFLKGAGLEMCLVN